MLSQLLSLCCFFRFLGDGPLSLSGKDRNKIAIATHPVDDMAVNDGCVLCKASYHVLLCISV